MWCRRHHDGDDRFRKRVKQEGALNQLPMGDFGNGVGKFVRLNLPYFLIIAAAISISVYGIGNSGALWPDSPLYLNAALMFRDWLQSDLLFQPLEFATRQYAQYPAFHVPFHPPGYPGLLSLWFLIFGPSYTSARLFIAVCSAAAGCFLFAILNLLGVERKYAFFGSLLLLSLPELATWSRDTVSEVPALAFQLGATYLFLRWLGEKKHFFCFAAFVVAEMAFMSRVSSAGVIGVWILFAVLTGHRRSLISLPFLSSLVIYAVTNIAWVNFVARFARFELGVAGGSHEKLTLIGFVVGRLGNLSFYLENLPAIIGSFTLILFLVCFLLLVFRSKNQKDAGTFALCWLLGAFGFLLALGPVPENRYFVFVLPAFPLLIATSLSTQSFVKLPVWSTVATIALCVAANIYQVFPFPRGVLGYQEMARTLARSEAAGNIMSVTWQSQDLIYRYQALEPVVNRDIIRGDRTLAIRLSEYGGMSGGLDIPAVSIASTKNEFLDMVKLGRVRYVVTYAPVDRNSSTYTNEMKLAHESVRSMPDEFGLVFHSELVTEFAGGGERGEIFLWEFLGVLLDGPNELRVIVPTAGMEIDRGK